MARTGMLGSGRSCGSTEGSKAGGFAGVGPGAASPSVVDGTIIRSSETSFAATRRPPRVLPQPAGRPRKLN